MSLETWQFMFIGIKEFHCSPHKAFGISANDENGNIVKHAVYFLCDEKHMLIQMTSKDWKGCPYCGEKLKISDDVRESICTK